MRGALTSSFPAAGTTASGEFCEASLTAGGHAGADGVGMVTLA